MRSLSSALPKSLRRRARGVYERWRLRWIRSFRSFGPPELLSALRSAGIEEGDTVMLHAGFGPETGFTANSGAVADAFLSAVGPTGNLMMVSLPYRGSTLAYLRSLDCFDVRKTPSRMGLVSEFFRRRANVVRSLHPTHPMLVCGPKAKWIAEGHEECADGCGPGSPFDKALQLDGKVVCFHAILRSMTFFHWLEHRVRDQVGVPLYHEPPFDVDVMDAAGTKRRIRVQAYSEEAIRRRRFSILERELRKRDLVATRRIGNTVLHAVRLRDVVACVDEMAAQGLYFYDLS